jgi:HD-GYP domain-containing protein (c-di-GMP phosphodiesterase class II)
MRTGLPPAVSELFAYGFDRWDGKSSVGRAEGEGIPLPIRIAHVAHDADVQRVLGGAEQAAAVIRARAGHAFDPAIVARFVDDATEILALDDDTSAWDEALACEPVPRVTLEREAIDGALAAMGNFADLASPYLVGNSGAVARLASEAARRCRLEAAEATALRRAALVHDLGRVAVPVRIWQKPGPLTPGEWEKVRLHPYQTERVLCHAPMLAAIAPVASADHERLDGSGYHRGAVASSLPRAARLLAAADAYHAMTQPRPHREAMAPERAAATLGADANAGLLDADAVAAVIEAAGQPAQRLERPAGLTEREAEVVGLLARGLQAKQVARQLEISVKPADRHVQNAYGKIGVSTRAGATLFAMEHGLAAWGELPISSAAVRS